jgi:hypothetical protein
LEVDLNRSYLTTMEAALAPLDEGRRREIVAEISGHLEDKARWLMLCGLSEEASMEKATEAFGDPAEVGRELKQVHGGATRRDALLAALPPVLLGLSIGISLLLRAPLSQVVIGGPTRVHYSPGVITGGLMVTIGLIGLAALILVIGGVVAMARRLPLWGTTWVGATVMVIVFALMTFAEDLPYLVSPAIDVLIMMALMLLLAAALGAVGWRGPSLGGLAGLSTTMILSLVVVSWASNPPINRLDVGLLVGPLGLAYGGLLYGFVTGPPARRVALLAVGGLICLGTMVGVEYGVFWQWRVSHGRPGQPLILLAVGMALLAFGPAVGLVAQRLRPRMA